MGGLMKTNGQNVKRQASHKWSGSVGRHAKTLRQQLRKWRYEMLKTGHEVDDPLVVKMFNM